MNNKKILILEGGYNEEHDVSLKSSIEIQKVLKKNKIKFKTLIVDPDNFEKKISKFKNYICFNALHGPYGEDGRIQKILNKMRISYTHSGYKSSKICFDKIATKNLLRKNNISTPSFVTINKKDLNKNKLLIFKKKFKKFIIKPSSSGSSFGIKIIKNNNDLKKFIKKINKYKESIFLHDHILIEEYISGKELTVSTIELSKKIEALAVTEIKYKNNFFDYEAKYSKGLSTHHLPANLSKKNYNDCLKLAEKSHKLLGCKSISRSDFIFNAKLKKLFFLEINTQPGLTSFSLLPEQAKYRKISFEKLIFSILKNTN